MFVKMKVGDKYKVVATTGSYTYGMIITVTAFNKVKIGPFKFNVKFNEIQGLYRMPNGNMIPFKREENLDILLNQKS